MRPKSGAPIVAAQSPGEAILQGNLAQVRYLLELGHGPNDRLDANHACKTPLMLCAYVTDKAWATSVASCLLEKGGLVGIKDKNGLNALHYACIYERDHLVELFLKAADYDLNQTDRFGNTALHYAARSANHRSAILLVDCLIKFGMTVDKQNRKGVTPLMQAWMNFNIPVADHLLEIGKADQNIKDLKGVSAFEYEYECRRKMRNNQNENYEKFKLKQIRFDDIQAWKLKQEKLMEAKKNFRFKTWNELKLEKERNSVEMPKEEENCITPSERSNARNNPAYLFRTKPCELFERSSTNTARSSVPASKKSFPTLSVSNSQINRTRSASPNPRIHLPEDVIERPKTSLSNHIKSDTIDGSSGKPHWRNQMMNIYDQYAFQCSPSYCQAATFQASLDDPSLVGGFLDSPSFNEKDSNLLDSDSFANAQKWRHGSQVIGTLARLKNQKKSDRKISNSPQRLTETEHSPSLNAVMESAAAVTKFKKYSRVKH